MGTFAYTGQDVNGDPATTGGNINIVTKKTTDMLFQDVDDILGIVQTGEYVSLDGGQTYLSYTFLGYGEVRGDSEQVAGFLRIDLGDGTTTTIAIDMNYDGDGVPNLQNGNTKLKVGDLTPEPPSPPPCFTPGTPIDTLRGRVPVEALDEGDMIWTLDHGFQPLRGLAQTEVPALGRYAPVRFAPGTVGNDDVLIVSPQHRMLVRGWRAELHFGEAEVLVPAIGLVDGDGVRQVFGGRVTYLHLLMDRHEILRAAGALTESYFLSPDKFAGDDAAEELRRLFPTLAAALKPVGSARPQLRRRETGALRIAARAA